MKPNLSENPPQRREPGQPKDDASHSTCDLDGGVEPSQLAINSTAYAHICLVEDEPDLCVIYRILFRKLGAKWNCRVSCVNSGKECLELLSSEGGSDVDVVISDLKMPEMDGFDLLATLKRRFPTIKLFACSAYTDATNVEKALAAGARLCFRKPLDIGAVEQELFPSGNRGMMA